MRRLICILTLTALSIGCTSVNDSTETASAVGAQEDEMTVSSVLAGQAFEVQGFGEDGEGDCPPACEPPIAGTTLTASFNATQLTGSGGCNSYTANYALSDVSGNSMQAEGKIKITDLASSKKYCSVPEGIMKQEQIFFECLRATTDFDLDPDYGFQTDDGGEECIVSWDPKPSP